MKFADGRSKTLVVLWHGGWDVEGDSRWMEV